MSPQGISASPLRVNLVESLGERAAEWDNLVDRQPLPTPFLKSWWVDNTAGATPVILCCFDGSELVGGAAFEIDRIGRGPFGVERVRCLGQGVLAPDHLDVIATPEARGRVLAATIDWLNRAGSRIVDLEGLAAGGDLAGTLADSEIDRTTAPFAALPPDATAYLSERPGKVRSTIKRSRNRFTRLGVTHTAVDPLDDSALNRAFDSLAELHDDRWSEKSSFLSAFDRFRRAATLAAKQGDLQIHQLSGPGSGVVAIEVDLLAGSRVCFYQAGRRTEHDWRGCGTVLRADIIESIAAEGRLEYDLLRGNEGYKSEWATGERQLIRCRFGVGPAGKLLASGANGWKRWQPAVADARSSLREALSRVPSPRRREPRDAK